MKLTRRHWKRYVALASLDACAVTSQGVRAQGAAFPSRPLRLIAGGAGSTTDIRLAGWQNALAPRSVSP